MPFNFFSNRLTIFNLYLDIPKKFNAICDEIQRFIANLLNLLDTVNIYILINVLCTQNILSANFYAISIFSK